MMNFNLNNYFNVILDNQKYNLAHMTLLQPVFTIPECLIKEYGLYLHTYIYTQIFINYTHKLTFMDNIFKLIKIF